MINFKGKTILVLGLKSSGLHVIQLLNANHIRLFMTDQLLLPNDIEINRELNTYISYDSVINQVEQFDIIIKSPGIPDDIELIKSARKLGVMIISEIEAAYQFIPIGKKVIGITGTNGKTTTTTLITKVLNESGIKACSCGNIGYTLSEAILVDLYDVFVCECSSFQLTNITDFKVDIAVLLNITPNHLEYHHTFTDYLNAKLNLLKNQTEHQIIVYNLDDPIIKERVESYKQPKKSYSLENREADCYLLDHTLYYKGKPLIDIGQIKLQGKENLANIMAVITVCLSVGINEVQIIEVITHFEPLKYRIQYIDTVYGVQYYNDSKSTNVKATLCAVDAIDEPIILIAGGKLKTDNYEVLISHEKLKIIIAFGENRYELKRIADETNKICFVCVNLLEVMRLIKKIVHKGDIVLFSPAAQSYDLYPNYVERGEDFNKLLTTVIKF